MKCSSGVYLGYLGAAFLAVLAACSSRKETFPAALTSSFERTVNANDVSGCAALFTEDAEVLEEDAPVMRGNEAIREFCAEQVHPNLSLDTASTMSIVSGDLAVEQGTYRVRNVKIGADVEYGEYFNVWREQGGQWKIFRSMLIATKTTAANISVSETDQDAPNEVSDPSE